MSKADPSTMATGASAVAVGAVEPAAVDAVVSSPRAVVIGAIAFVLAAVSVTASLAVDWTWGEYVASYTFTNAVVGVSLALSGALILWHRPRNTVGIILAVAGLGHLVSAAAAPVGILGIAAGWPEALTRTLATMFSVAWTIGLPSLFMLALLLFPDGRLPSPRWRWAGWTIVGFAGWSVVTSALLPLPVFEDEPGSISILAWPGMPIEVVDIVTLVVSAALVPIALAALIVRYVRGDDRTRRQLLWLILAVFAMLLVNAQRWVTGDGPVLLLLSFSLLPVAIAIAIIRYQLLDIRVVLSRTVLYTLLIALVIALYAGLVALLTLVVPPDAGRLVAAASAVAVALAFNPLRILLQRAIGRAFYGTRRDPAATAVRVGSRVGDGGDDAATLDDVLGELRAALRLPRMALLDASGTVVAEAGEAPAGAGSAVLDFPGAVGRLDVTLRSGERLLHHDDRRAVSLLIPLFALLLRERALAAALRDARAQTVEARERERQTLHRELHDGLGPTLTGAGLRADAAANMLDARPDRARELLAEVRADVRDALAEVRRVVYGLRPLALDERGLMGAVREYASHSAGVSVAVTGDERLPALSPAVELAAYRIALEGIANAQRHSSGTTATVEFDMDGDVLRVRVNDDGTPGADYSPGVGIRSLIERAEELGGTAQVGPTERGWLVSATLPTR